MKIIFKDKPEEIVEVVRAEQLANTKVRVTPETSRQIQEAAFKLGFAWGDGDIVVQKTYAKYLYFHEGLYFYIQLGHQYSVFIDSKCKEFEFLPSLSSPSELQDSNADREKLISQFAESICFYLVEHDHIDEQKAEGLVRGFLESYDRLPKSSTPLNPS